MDVYPPLIMNNHAMWPFRVGYEHISNLVDNHAKATQAQTSSSKESSGEGPSQDLESGSSELNFVHERKM